MKLNVFILMSNDTSYTIKYSQFNKEINAEIDKEVKDLSTIVFDTEGFSYNEDDVTYIYCKNDLSSKDKRKRDMKDFETNIKLICSNSIDLIIFITESNDYKNLLLGTVQSMCNEFGIMFTDISFDSIVQNARRSNPKVFEGKIVGFLRRNE